MLCDTEEQPFNLEVEVFTSDRLVPETGTLMELPMAMANLDIPNIVQFICKIIPYINAFINDLKC